MAAERPLARALLAEVSVKVVRLETFGGFHVYLVSLSIT
jgi:hypothetical protein